MKRFQTIFLSLIVAMSAFADIHVKGKVIDADNSEPMIGVSILVKGSTIGTVTDLDGSFEMSVPDKATLQLSYMGYKTIEIRAVDNMNIIMESDALQLQEVVSLIASQQRNRSTGSQCGDSHSWYRFNHRSQRTRLCRRRCHGWFL